MTDTECFLLAVREYRAAELAMGRILPAFEDYNSDDRARVLARAQELKEGVKPSTTRQFLDTASGQQLLHTQARAKCPH